MGDTILKITQGHVYQIPYTTLLKFLHNLTICLIDKIKCHLGHKEFLSETTKETRYQLSKLWRVHFCEAWSSSEESRGFCVVFGQRIMITEIRETKVNQSGHRDKSWELARCYKVTIRKVMCVSVCECVVAECWEVMRSHLLIIFKPILQVVS